MSRIAWNTRNDIGLPPQLKLLQSTKIKESEFLVHYQQDKSTKEIANELHVTYDFLYEWMRKHKYKVNRKKDLRKAGMLPSPLHR
ncbi:MULTISPECIES: hypothetical protein [unclassified Methanosarcina]|uniref:hypothetical protein n=1 Tax=unclassified Methanosarcina TaxID=2644672 RepID=UPI0012E0087A|nr:MULTISPECIES: hypothetical protein [unclassified Methanosarcina]